MAEKQRLYKAKDAAAWLGVEQATLRKWSTAEGMRWQSDPYNRRVRLLAEEDVERLAQIHTVTLPPLVARLVALEELVNQMQADLSAQRHALDELRRRRTRFSSTFPTLPAFPALAGENSGENSDAEQDERNSDADHALNADFSPQGYDATPLPPKALSRPAQRVRGAITRPLQTVVDGPPLSRLPEGWVSLEAFAHRHQIAPATAKKAVAHGHITITRNERGYSQGWGKGLVKEALDPQQQAQAHRNPNWLRWGKPCRHCGWPGD